jgi:GalNAc-alpha-(1->4)-GalNAc-alpha-(1->3)-diNAcBac-PP-undecaprenol alpha-1,4-N-acetyl-D-galactosaminyltransferase
MKRITFVATDLSTGGGVNKVIRDLAVLFARRLAAEVTVVNARSDRLSTYPFPDDVPVQNHRRQTLPSYFRLLLRLRRSRPDFVISSWTQDNILVVLAFLFSRTKTILVEHSSWHFHSWPIRFLRRAVYPLASSVVVLNRRDLDHYRAYLSDVRLIPDPVTAPSLPPEQRERLIIAVGHFSPLKNFEDAIRAMAKSGLEQDGWSLAIVGSGPREAQLRGLIEELGLRWTHIHAPTQDLAFWYARASLLLVTSHLESFSLVLAEAMLSGVVPIAYASDGPSFILEDFGEHLVEIGDVDALAKQLAHFASETNPEALRKALRASIESRFSPDIIVDEWRRLLEAPPCQ